MNNRATGGIERGSRAPGKGRDAVTRKKQRRRERRGGDTAEHTANSYYR